MLVSIAASDGGTGRSNTVKLNGTTVATTTASGSIVTGNNALVPVVQGSTITVSISVARRDWGTCGYCVSLSFFSV